MILFVETFGDDLNWLQKSGKANIKGVLKGPYLPVLLAFWLLPLDRAIFA